MLCSACVALVCSSSVDGSDTNDGNTSLIDMDSWGAVATISGVTIQSTGRATYEATNDGL